MDRGADGGTGPRPVAPRVLDELSQNPGDVSRSVGGSLVECREALLEGFNYRLKTSRGTSNLVFVGFAASTVVLEEEPNDQAANSQLVMVPCEYVGQFYPRGDMVFYCLFADGPIGALHSGEHRAQSF